MAYLEPQKPPIVIRPALGAMVILPPLNEWGKSFVRSSVKNGVLPFGKVNRSRPARRVEVASMRMLLLSVREKYPGEASPSSRMKSDSIVMPRHDEWNTICIVHPQALTPCRIRCACFKSTKTDQRHDLKVSVAP